MTREEAIHRLKNTAWLGTNKDREETEQAVDMAIEALKADDEMCGAEMADNSLFNDITESSNDVVESKDDVITEDYMWD